MSEAIREVDLRLAISHLAQTVYGTALTATDLGTNGKNFRATAPVLPTIQQIFAGRGSMPFSGHEWGEQASERELLNDLQFSLAFRANSFLLGWAAALALGGVTSVLEGATGHYTHTIVPTRPLLGGGTFDAKVTSMFFHAGNVEAAPRKAIFPSLAIPRFSLSLRPREECLLSVDFIGSGVEDTTTSVTTPALTTEFILPGTGAKIEIGDTGGALTDYTSRFREGSIEIMQELKADLGYIPNAATPANGKFRSNMEFRKRSATLRLVLEADRASTDIYTRMKARTRSEVKITVDSGVVAGTGTKNHSFIFRVPDCRLSEAPYEFADGDAANAIQVAGDDMFISSAIGSVPFQFVVENTQVSYLV